MRITAELFHTRKEETVDLPEKGTAMDLLRKLGLAPDAHLLVRGDAPIPLDEPLRDGERVRILAVVSGGAPVRTGQSRGPPKL